ncbi:MAG: hypothetical protein CVV02_12465 [Firmicutes bacterium HGW-Firmicutes-7]|nr:MAG: hypothetical protein CVV02_12465 [Firmicutes bacterium HGW-Firmicutes-7]
MITSVIGLTFLIFVNILFFPISKYDLENRTVEVIQKELSKKISISESKEIPGSKLYLVTTVDKTKYLVHAEKTLLFSRYRLLYPMILEETQEFKISNLTNDIFVVYEGNSINVEWKRNISKLWPLIFISIVVLLNFVLWVVGKARKKKMLNKSTKY